MAEIRQSPSLVQRSEWVFYKALVSRLSANKTRVPAFGDYCINHPDVISIDMRLIKPAGTVRYTTDDSWFIVKGPNVRENGFEQFRGHCRAVVRSGRFSGPGFSWGDRYISDCAAGSARTGNLSTWRRVGTNRHIEKVVQDIATFFGSSAAP
jgi:hypothetical protein